MDLSSDLVTRSVDIIEYSTSNQSSLRSKKHL